MSERVSTEKAVDIAGRVDCAAGCKCAEKEAADALRSLAAERDRLGNEVEHHVEELDLRMKAIREQEKRMAALAAERDELARSLGLARTDAYQRGYADGKRLAAGSGDDGIS